MNAKREAVTAEINQLLMNYKIFCNSIIMRWLHMTLAPDEVMIGKDLTAMHIAVRFES